MKLAHLALSLAAIVVVALDVKLISAQRPTSFMTACNSLVNPEIFFTGVCSIRFPNTLLGQIADLINTTPDSETLDSFLRNRAFKGIGQFFRETYSTPIDPDTCSFFPNGWDNDFTSYLDALQLESLKFADRLLQPGCMTSIWVGEFSDPFFDSKFSDISDSVRDPFYCKHPNWAECGIDSSIGFCPNTRDLFKVQYLYEITNRTIDNLLRTYVNIIYTNYTLSAHLAGKNAFELLLTKIDSVGTGGTLMSDVKAFSNSEFYDGIRGWYLNETISTTRRTKTSTTPTTTTRTPRTTEKQPVSNIVIYLVPSLMAFISILAAVVIVALVYSFRPIVVHVQPQPIVNAAGGYVSNSKQEAIQMEKLNNAKV